MKRLIAVGLLCAVLGVTVMSPVAYAEEDVTTATLEEQGTDEVIALDSSTTSQTEMEEVRGNDENTQEPQDKDSQMDETQNEDGQTDDKQVENDQIDNVQILDNLEDSADEQTEEEPAVTLTPEISYQVHVQTMGWQSEVAEGKAAGTTGKALRLEGLKINLDGIPEGSGSIEYSTHVQSIGWQNYVGEGELSGTTGRALRLEAVRIRLTGELAEQYDIYYRMHIQSYGWLGWAKNGECAGSAGFAKRMEAMEIRLVKKGESAPGSTENCYVCKRVEYQAHSQSYGWMSKVYDDQVGGVTGKSKRLEAIKISLPSSEYAGSIEYRTYLQTYGWQGWKKDGALAGTTRQSKRIEAIQIKLTGEIAKYYDVYYSVHMSKIGWSAYVCNGAVAGSSDLSKKIEAIKIQLVKKDGGKIPNTKGVTYISGFTTSDFYYTGSIQGTGQSGNVQQGNTLGTVGKQKGLENIILYLNNAADGKPSGQISYSTYVSGKGWQGATGLGTVNGCKDGSSTIEAVKISLSGDIAKYYDIYYRAHCQKYGWLGWAKNGQAAGTTTQGYRMEALQIKLVAKEASAPGSNSNYYTEKKFRRYQNPSQYYQIKDSVSLSGGGYTLSYGFMGVKVMKVIQKLGLGNGVGMGGAFYGHNVENAVRAFQKRVGLPQTGKVDLLTWLRMGFTEIQWNQWGAYVSPMKVNADSSRSAHIEAMISTAYSYLGTPYVIGASGPPGTGIDCSGLVMQGLYAAGMDLSPINPVRHAHPGYEYESRNMWASSKFMKVPYSQRQRGDLIFYQNGNGVVIHVAIYLGNDQVIEAWPNKVVIWPIIHWQRPNVKGVIRPFV